MQTQSPLILISKLGLKNFAKSTYEFLAGLNLDTIILIYKFVSN
jgi:hypothetical protein